MVASEMVACGGRSGRQKVIGLCHYNDCNCCCLCLKPQLSFGMEGELLVMTEWCKVFGVGSLSCWPRGWEREFSGFREKQSRLTEKRRKGRELMMTGLVKKITWISLLILYIFSVVRDFALIFIHLSFLRYFLSSLFFFVFSPLVHVANSYIYRGKCNHLACTLHEVAALWILQRVERHVLLQSRSCIVQVSEQCRNMQNWF